MRGRALENFSLMSEKGSQFVSVCHVNIRLFIVFTNPNLTLTDSNMTQLVFR